MLKELKVGGQIEATVYCDDFTLSDIRKGPPEK